MAADATTTESWWNGEAFDRILIDAPCSGTGVIRRHPDIKKLRTPEDISSFREKQLALLENLWKTLAVGGKLLYATCSILKSENQDVVSRFIKDHEDVEVLPIKTPESLKGSGPKTSIYPCNPGIQLFPMARAHDGFYYALMAKA